MSERLWAPWRMEYLQGKKGGPCVFCSLATAPASSYRENLVLLVQPHALVCLNKYPFAAAHILVAPRRHTGDLDALSGDEYAETMALVREATGRVMRATGAEGINVGLNLGKAAGAGITDHLHVHVVPRWNGDSNFMPVIADTRVMPEHLDASFARLEPLFADLPGEHPAPAGPAA
jgi:ATP adenylyltransferase